MPADDSVPSFLDLHHAKTARSKRRLAQPGLPLDFDSLPTLPSPSATGPQPSDLSSSSSVQPKAQAHAPLEPVLYTVRQLIAELRRHVEGAYAGIVNVEGEISNCRAAGSGHIYFTLKDGDAQLSAVFFRRNAQLLGFKLKDGLAVEVRGRLSVYETRGQLQLIAETARPRGTGALQFAFEQLRDRLRLEGLFDRPRKPLPPFPRCIGIVTSPGGAAIRDIIQVVRRRHGRLNLLIYPAIMQGAQCPSTVAAGIRWFNRNPHRVDLILLARGGGSLEDLAGFNDEALARTIVGSALPVVSAIGHEIDNTISDYVADLRAPTPSAAAELITAAQHRIEEHVASLERRVLRAAEFHLMRARQRLQRLSAEQVLARVRDSIGRREQRLDELHFRLSNALERRRRDLANRVSGLESRLRRHHPANRLNLAVRRQAMAEERLTRLSQQIIGKSSRRLQAASLRLEALSPLAVLNRGYAIVYLETKTQPAILRSAADVSAGQSVRARLAQGSIRAIITETQAS